MKNKVLAGLFILCTITCSLAQEAASERVIHKTKDGRIIGKEQIDSMQKVGPLQMSTTFINGKTEIIISNTSKEEMEAQKNEKNDFISEWTGKAAPAASFTGLDGKTYSPASLKGKTVVLNFWFIGCKPCVQEMPQLNKLVAKYKDNEGVIFLAPALDKADKLQAFLQKRSFDYTIMAGAGKSTRDDFGISTWPTHMVINKNGIIEKVFIGGSEHIGQEVEAALKKALTKK